MAKASDKYRNWFESDKLVSDLMDQAADDIDERDAEIERLREALRKIAEFDLYGDYSNGYEIPKIAAHALLQQKDSE
jgi:hypothetical protein